MSIKVKTMPLGMLEANCHIFWDTQTKAAAVIDIGGDAGRVKDFLIEKGLVLKWILLTHGHVDHIGGAMELKSLIDAPIAIHTKDEEMLLEPQKNASAMFPGKPVAFSPDRLLESGDELELGDLKIVVHHTPGHTRGGVCFEIGEYLATGDTLFQGSIGRTDLYGGDMQVMRKTLEKIATWPNQWVVLPGHGPQTTLRDEKRQNPYLSRLIKA